MSETIKTKICSKCKREKDIMLFSVKKDNADGFRSNCKDCDKQYRVINQEKIKKQKKEYSDSNNEKVRKQKRDSYARNKQTSINYNINNKEKINEYKNKNRRKIQKDQKEYYLKNKDKIDKRIKEYGKTDIGKCIALNTMHKRRSITQKGDITGIQLLELRQSAKVCYWCKCSLKKVKVNVDHYVPLSKGGEHTISNLVISCQSCNRSKSDKDPVVYANSVGKLL